MAVIPIRQLRRDMPDLNNPGSTRATNVVPLTSQSYGPWRRPSVLSNNALDTRCGGMVSAPDYQGSIYTFAGDAGKLYNYTAATFADVSKFGGYTTAGVYADETSRFWHGAHFNNSLIVSNYSDPIQRWVLGTSSLFEDLAPLTAPMGKYVAIVGDSLVVANTDDAFDGQVPLRIWYGPIGAPWDDDWGNTDKQSDFRTMPTGRRITGIVGGEVGFLFCQTAVYQMTYIGAPLVWSIDQIATDHGCIAPGSIRSNEESIFYLAEDGFHRMVRGQSTPIGLEKVDNYFFATVDKTRMDRVVASLDEVRKLYIVSYPGPGNQGGLPNMQLIYNYYLDEWTEAEQAIEIMATLQGAATTIDALGLTYPLIDNVPGAVDSPEWSGGIEFLAGFNENHFLVGFNGPNAAARIEGPEINLSNGSRSTVKAARVISDTDAVQARVGKRDGQAETVVYSTPSAKNARTGLYSFRETARYHRARFDIPEGTVWNYFQGMGDLEFVKAGN